jgi:hypothetical protein
MPPVIVDLLDTTDEEEDFESEEGTADLAESEDEEGGVRLVEMATKDAKPMQGMLKKREYACVRHVLGFC